MLRSTYLTLLAAVTLGTDQAISDVDFVNSIHTSPTPLHTSATHSKQQVLLGSATAPSSASLLSSQSLLQMSHSIMGYDTSAEVVHHHKKNLSTSDTNVTVQIGSHAYLPCNIRRLMNKPVSWVRVRDGHILTVDQTTFIADQRFQSIFQEEEDYTWSMQIKYVQEHDMGWYECQVATEPKMSAKVYLKVVVPKTEMIGDHNRFVKAGSKVALHCLVRGSLEPPSYIIWFHGDQQVVEDNAQGWYMQIDREIFGNSSDQQNTIGSLIIPYVKKKDSGKFTCTPSNSASVSVDLHVLSGEYSASAIMSSAITNSKQSSLHFHVALTLILAVLCAT